MPDTVQPKWESRTLLICAVVAAVAAVLALLPIPELHPFFTFFRLTVPLWITLPAVVLAVCVPGIVFKRRSGRSLSESVDESEIRKRCGLTIRNWSRIEGN